MPKWVVTYIHNKVWLRSFLAFYLTAKKKERKKEEKNSMHYALIDWWITIYSGLNSIDLEVERGNVSLPFHVTQNESYST